MAIRTRKFRFIGSMLATLMALAGIGPAHAAVSITEPPDLPDSGDLGFPASGPTTVLMPGVNTVSGNVEFSAVGAVATNRDDDLLLVEIPPGYTLVRFAVTLGEFELTGDATVVSFNSALADTEYANVAGPGVFFDPTTDSPGDSESQDVSVSEGTYVLLVGTGGDAVDGGWNFDYRVEMELREAREKQVPRPIPVNPNWMLLALAFTLLLLGRVATSRIQARQGQAD